MPRTPPLSSRAAAAEAAEEARAERRLHQKLLRLRQYDAPQRHQGLSAAPPSLHSPVVPVPQQLASRARGAARPEMA